MLPSTAPFLLRSIDSVPDLLHVMSYFFNRRGSATGKKLFAELVATVERRWFEVEVRSQVLG